MQGEIRTMRGSRDFVRRILLPACIAGLLGLFSGGWAVLQAAQPPGEVPALGCYLDTSNKICETTFGETCSTCPKDCGRCPPNEPSPGNVCDNDQVCEPDQGEATYNCGDCPSVCGDAICAPEEVNSCGVDCPLNITCGDSVCGALESFSTCPLDCDPPTRTPTATEIPTRTVTVTTHAPEATEEEATSVPASDTPVPTRTATATSEEVIVSLATLTATPQGPACEIVGVNEISGAVVEEFVKQTHGYTAIIWMRCREAPVLVCLPSDPVLGIGTDMLLEISLLDCDAKGCAVIPATSADDDVFCLDAEIAGREPGCTDGCAFARFAPDTPEESSLPPATVPIVFGVGTAALILLLVLLFVRRRSGDDQEEVSDDM